MPPRKRKAKASPPEAEPSLEMEVDPSPSPENSDTTRAGTRLRSRTTKGTANTSDGSAAKKAKLNVAQTSVEEAAAIEASTPPVEIGSALATDKSKVLPPRERDPHPGAIVLPPPRRTPAQMRREQEEFTHMEKQIQEMDRKRRDIVAEYELAQEREDMEDERTAIRSLSDLQMQDSGEMQDPDAQDANEPMLIDTQNETSTKTKQASARKRKIERGETKASVDARKAELKKKALSERPHHLAGINPDWHTTAVVKAKANSRSVTETQPSEDTEVEVLGGLDDEDTFSVPPEEVVERRKASGAQTKPNQLVLLVADDEQPEPTATKTNVKPRKPVTQSSCTPARTPARQVAKSEAVKREASDSIIATPVSVSATDADGLPMWLKPDWSTRFLPTAYHRLFSSADPLREFNKSQAFIDILQELLDIVYPGHTYTVQWNDKVFQTAYQRLSEKRSQFGADAITHVKTFFKQGSMANNPAAIAAYAKWALTPDGPALYKVPTPQDSAKKGEPNYIMPVDIFESKFFVELLTPILKSNRRSVGDFGHPVGAISMASAAIERVFLSFTTGSHVKPAARFSVDSVGRMVDNYMKNAQRLTERRWTQILASYKALPSQAQQALALVGTPSLEAEREDLYQPSSP
ncbi:hypothetical protein B0H34DRAFT_731990 [Crassisporium funariophilum]|nr:hypothetical protein B0H34DRAFT_731990 [Crassisporium funariophilum]